MKILVCLKEVVDTALSLDAGLRYPFVFRKGLPMRLNPNDAAALNIALGLKESLKAEITLVSIGGEAVVKYLRNGLALGADRAFRIREEGFEELSPGQKAALLAGAVLVFPADVIFTGAKSADTGSGAVGPMLAARLGLPCITDVFKIEFDERQEVLTATREAGRGVSEKVACSLPAVLTVKGEAKPPYANLDAFIRSKNEEITLLRAVDLGIAGELKSPVKPAGLVSPRPRPRKATPLDTTLPAFDRILQLLAGGMVRRRGLKLEGDAEEMAQKLFELLQEEGIINTMAEK